MVQKLGEGKNRKFLINGLQTGNLSGKCFLTMNVLNANELFITAEVVKVSQLLLYTLP